MTRNDVVGEVFMQQVDSAGVYKNASTRIADEFKYGLVQRYVFLYVDYIISFNRYLD